MRVGKALEVSGSHGLTTQRDDAEKSIESLPREVSSVTFKIASVVFRQGSVTSSRNHLCPEQTQVALMKEILRKFSRPTDLLLHASERRFLQRA